MLMDEVDEVLERKLVDAACKARQSAYAPYSKFKVGAAILSNSGKIYTGCNVENSSFGGTCCAERVALYNGVSQGERSFLAIAVVIGGEGFASPCGICRQVLAEFGADMRVLMGNTSGEYNVKSLDLLLPHAFLLNEKYINEQENC